MGCTNLHPAIPGIEGEAFRRVWKRGGGFPVFRKKAELGALVLDRARCQGGQVLAGMITYVHCLSPGPVVSCWDKACYEVPSGEKPTLCSVQTKKKMGNSLQHPPFPSPRPEGCLRKHFFSMSKVHQRPSSLWTPKPLLAPVSKGGPGKMHQDGKGRGRRDYITVHQILATFN